MKLIVGLGNPGSEYEKTRHNVGFMVLDALHTALSSSSYTISAWSNNKKFHAEVSGGTVRNEQYLLVKPNTFMNNSGDAVAALAHYYKVPPRDIIVVHDDKDIPLGQVKVQMGRGDGGHNGIKSIFEKIGTKEIERVRIGVANEKLKHKDTSVFVLQKFGLFERKHVQTIITETVQLLMGRMEKSA